MTAEPLPDEPFIPRVPVPGIIRFPYDKRLDREVQELLTRVRDEMLAEQARKKREDAAAAEAAYQESMRRPST